MASLMLTITYTLNQSILANAPQHCHQAFATALTSSIVNRYPSAKVNILEASVTGDYEISIDCKITSVIGLIAAKVEVMGERVLFGEHWNERVLH